MRTSLRRAAMLLRTLLINVRFRPKRPWDAGHFLENDTVLFDSSAPNEVVGHLVTLFIFKWSSCVLSEGRSFKIVSVAPHTGARRNMNRCWDGLLWR
jgi:hypothetical protein